MPVTVSRKTDIKKIVKKVNEDRTPITIVNDNGLSAVVMATEDFESMNETIYLLSSKANARWIYESVKEMENNQTKVFDIDELEKMVNEY